jgi:hypothetical protein
LFLTDGFKAYLPAALTHYEQWVQQPRGWATGRLPKPRWLPLPQLQYAPVIKQTRRRRLVAVSSRVVFGTLAGCGFHTEHTFTQQAGAPFAKVVT